jgi:hypothetical protein
MQADARKSLMASLDLNYFSLEVKLENPCKRAVIDQETISF